MQFYNTDDLPQDLAELSFAANIARIFPNGEAPLYAMSGLARKKTAKQIEHGYWSKTMQFGRATLSAGITTAGQTTLAITSNLGAGAVGGVTVGDILKLASPFSGGAYVAPELVRVSAVTSTTAIEVERAFGGTTAKATFASGSVLPVVGNAFAQGSMKPVSKAIVPVRHLNYTHIFRNAWSQSKTLAAVQQIVGDGTIAENKRDCTEFHSRDMELATFFSRRSQGIDPVTNQPISTMAGIEQLIEDDAPANIKEAGATTTYDQLIAMVDGSFDQRIGGMEGNYRVAYCGKTAINVINKIGRLSGNYEIVDGATSFGLKFKRVVLPRGIIDLVEHPIFNTHPDCQSLMVLGELSSFDYAYLEGRDTEVTYINEMDKATDGQDASGGVLTTELTIELQNPFAWSMIYGLTDAAA